MKLSDELLLKSLRADVLSGVADDQWELVCKAVDEAGDIREVRGYARTVIFDAIEKFNPYHDEVGRFTSGGAGGAGRSARVGMSLSDLDAEMQNLSAGNKAIVTNSRRFAEDSREFRLSNPYRANTTEALIANLKMAQERTAPKTEQPFLDTTDIEADMGGGAKGFLDTTDIEADMGGGAKSGKSSDAPTLDGMKVKQVKSTPSTVKRIMRALYDDDGPATSASEIADWVRSGDLEPSQVPKGWRAGVEAELNK